MDSICAVSQLQPEPSVVFHSLLLPCKLSSDNLNLIFVPPFGSNYLATNFQYFFDVSTHALIGSYYINNSTEGIKYESIAWSP